MTTLWSQLAAFGAIGAALLSVTSTFAQTSDPGRTATAQVLFDQAESEIEKKEFASACKKLEEVTRLLPDAIGAKMRLGDCYEALGKTASAWSQYILAEAAASKQEQPERAQLAAEKATSLKKKLAMLTIAVPAQIATIPGLLITRDGIAIGEGQWGTPLPVDAGSHEIKVVASGRRPWTTQVEILADGTTLTVNVQVFEAEVEPRRPPPTPLLGAKQHAIGFGVLGVGAAGLVFGALMGGLSIWKRDASNSGPCDANGYCEPSGMALRNDALIFGNMSTGAFIAGSVLAATGVVFVLTATPPNRRSTSQNLGIQVRPGMIALVGSF